MQVEVAVLADCANMADGDKLNVMGMFDRLRSPSFPVALPYMVLALRLRLEFEDGNRAHTLVIELRDQDGGLWGGGRADIQVGPIPAGARDILSQILPFPGMTFPHPGEYAFSLQWDGVEKHKALLSVELQQAQPTQ